MEKKKILIVDDEEGLCRLIQLNLEETGQYQVRIETKGVKALAAAQEFKPDLILLDVLMPDKKGSEVAREIKADPSIREIPIVFLTAIASSEIAERVPLNQFPIIEKPISLEALIASIEKNLQPGKI